MLQKLILLILLIKSTSSCSSTHYLPTVTPQGAAVPLHPTTIQSPLTLIHFANKSVQCNDGTTAGYYIRRSSGIVISLKWIVFLEGGWFCFDETSCRNRWLRMSNLMSSSSWPRHQHVNGILSPDPNENPHWWNANHVYLPYCSSDTWSGTTPKKNKKTFAFMGSLIIDELFSSLVRSGDIQSESTVVLTGSSAGGTGVLLNLDRVKSLLKSTLGSSINVRGISDSAWFMDKLPSYLEEVECREDVTLCPPEISLRKGMELWGSRVPESCREAYPEEPWSCFFGYRVYPSVGAPLFIFQWLFDEAQMVASKLPPIYSLKKEEWDYVYRVGDELRKSLFNVTNVFAPACLAHTVLTHKDWRKIELNSVTLPRALSCWEEFEESNFIRPWDHHQFKKMSNDPRRNRRRQHRTQKKSKRNHTRNSLQKKKQRRRRRRRWLCEDIRLIEKCQWPQCNKSCPKLYNPLTGDEVEFKDLLKSFGLDLGSMARALGMDLATLNQLDHQVLLQMLTQNA